MRTLVGIAGGVLFLAALVYITMVETGTECEVCVDFEGRSSCSVARGGDRDQAIAQALSSACAVITNGVTEVVKCGGTVPTSARCKG